MPFEETHVVDERTCFIADVHRSLKSFTAICERYGISRTTGYKWLARWKAHGPPGLEDRPSRPKHCPWATTPEVVEAILDLRRTYDDYGAKKIRWFLQRHRPELDLPSRTTIHNILCRHDLVPKRRRRVRRWHPGRPDTSAIRPTRAGARTSRASSRPAMVTSATRSPSRTCTRASCSPATAALMSPSMA